MLIRKSITSAFLICFLLLPTVSADEKQADKPAPKKIQVEVRGDVGDDYISLAWHVDAADPSWRGFRVMKRPITAQGDGKWTPAIDEVIVPGLLENRPLDKIVADPEFRKKVANQQDKLFPPDDRYTKAYKAILNQRKFNHATSNELMLINMKMWVRLEAAVLMGFGCVIPRPDDDIAHEYGIFPVGEDATKALPMAASFIEYDRSDKNLLPKSFRTTTRREQLRLLWDWPEDLKNKRHLYRFNVYRVEPDGKHTLLDDRIGQVSVPTSLRGIMTYSYPDTKAALDSKHRYRIVPVGPFGSELKVSIEIVYTPKSTDPAHLAAEKKAKEMLASVQQSFKITSVDNVKDGGIQIQWEIKPTESIKPASFLVESRKFENGKFTRFTPFVSNLSSKTREAFDKNTHKSGDIIDYRITAQLNTGKTLRSNGIRHVYIGKPTPKIPKDLKARYLPGDEKEKGVVQLSWQKADDDPLTHQYAIYTDRVTQGKLTYESRWSPVSETQVKLPLSIPSSRHIELAVVAVSKNGVKSNKARVECFVPGRVIPPISNFRATPNPAKRSYQLSWKYPVADKAIIGFRIYQGKKQIASEHDINLGQTAFVVSKLEIGKSYEFSIEAVSLSGQTSLRKSTPLTKLRPAPKFSSPRAVENVTVTRRQTEDGEHFIDLSWTPAKTGPPPTHYIIQSDIKTHWKMRTIGRDIEKPSFSLQINDPARSYAIAIYPIGENGANGIPKTVISLKSEQALAYPRIKGMKVKDGQSTIRWRQTFDDGVIGFRLFADGQIVLKESDLKATARSIDSTDPRLLNAKVIAIQAIGSDERVSDVVSFQVSK